MGDEVRHVDDIAERTGAHPGALYRGLGRDYFSRQNSSIG
ncbi:hypothetical protein [Streptomyces anulatus]